MRVRDDCLEHQKDMGTSGTKTFDLDYSDVITGIDLDFGGTNGATSNKNAPLERLISKIEIVDGGESLWNLPGDVAYALFAQQHGAPGDDYYTECPTDTPYVSIPVRFGRYLYDPDFGFVPRNFKNPQLKITFDEATVQAAGATGYVSDSIHLSIIVRLMEEAAAPGSYLMAKDVEDYTSLASGDHTSDMPTDYPWRLLMVRAYEAGTDLRGSISNYKLNCDRGKYIPFDLSSGNLVSRMAEMFPMTMRSGYIRGDDGDTVETWMGIDVAQAIHARTATRFVVAGAFWPGRFTYHAYNEDGTAQNDVDAHWIVHGYCPHNTLIVPFGRLDVPGEWFNAPAHNSVVLYQTQADADAEVNVCVQQARSY